MVIVIETTKIQLISLVKSAIKTCYMTF